MAGFFLPTWYELTDESVRVRGLVDQTGEALERLPDPPSTERECCCRRSRSVEAREASEASRSSSTGIGDEVLAFVERAMGERGGPDADVGDEGQAE